LPRPDKEMKKAILSLLLISVSSIFSIPNLTAQAKEAAIERASQAIKTEDYVAAVRICLEQLRFDPVDYELNFLLSRAYAYSGQWDEAMKVLNKMADAYPENTDVLLLRARIEARKKNYSPAEKSYIQVLRLDPGNGEALIGLAEVASWQGRYAEAVANYDQFRQRNPADAEIYFRLGRVYLWQGNYDKARANFERARSLAPQNEGYQRILKTAIPRVRDQYELRAEYQAESCSDGRKDYVDQRLAFQFKLSTIGPLAIKANTTTRYDARDFQYGIEFYPRLWSRAYAYIDTAYSPKALHFPRVGYLAEIYQGIPSGWEFSLGHRRMNFSTLSVNVFLGSIARYIGRYIAFFRWYITPNNKGETFSWLINLRRYFTDSSYIYAAYGRGSRPFDIVFIEDYSVTRSWVFFTGFDWYLFNNIKLQLNYTLRDEGELRRNLLYLGAGYRW